MLPFECFAMACFLHPQKSQVFAEVELGSNLTKAVRRW